MKKENYIAPDSIVVNMAFEHDLLLLLSPNMTIEEWSEGDIVISF